MYAINDNYGASKGVGQPTQPGFGLGDASSIAISAGATASTAVIAATAAAPIPIVGPIIAGVALLIGALTHRLNPQQKINSSDFANTAEDHLKGNLADWQALPIKTKSVQNAAEGIFYQWWNWLVAQCQTQGNAGQKCISERQRGGQNSWGADWFQLYLDPIMNDPAVVDDSEVVTVTNPDGTQGVALRSQVQASAPSGSVDTTTLVNQAGSVAGTVVGSIGLPVLLGLGVLYFLAKKRI